MTSGEQSLPGSVWTTYLKYFISREIWFSGAKRLQGAKEVPGIEMTLVSTPQASNPTRTCPTTTWQEDRGRGRRPLSVSLTQGLSHEPSVHWLHLRVPKLVSRPRYRPALMTAGKRPEIVTPVLRSRAGRLLCSCLTPHPVLPLLSQGLPTSHPSSPPPDFRRVPMPPVTVH